MNEDLKTQILNKQLTDHADAFYIDEMPWCCRAAYNMGRVDALWLESKRNGKAIQEATDDYELAIHSTES